MKKRIISAVILLAAMLTLIVASVSVSAAPSVPRVCDLTKTLTAPQAEALCNIYDSASERLGFDMAAVITDNLGGKTYVDYADDYFDYNGFGVGNDYDGALLLISLEPNNRICYISTRGFGIQALSDDKINEILDILIDSYLSNGAFSQGIEKFADLCEDAVLQKRAEQKAESEFSLNRLLKWIGAGLVFGLIVAAIRIIYMKSKMKSVYMRNEADNYVKDGSLEITNSSDVFLYCHVSKEVIERGSGGSSTHTSSSGGVHGGGGRSF